MTIIDDGYRTCSICKSRYYDPNRIIVRNPICKNCLFQPERLSPEENFDDYLKDPGKYFRKMEDNLINGILSDSPNLANK